MIRIEKLNKFYNKGRQNEIHVINDLTLSLPERGMVAFFGMSGCGKTTLLNVIGGLDSFASGSVTFDGESIRRDTDNLRNRMVGYVFQNYCLNPERTCFENVADALFLCGVTDKGEIAARVSAALDAVGMKKFAKRLPTTLSGGQQQRVAIARAIVKNPPVLLADEPTGNLDEANTLAVMDLLRSIARDHLVLLVTHEADLVDRYCDRVIELSDGRTVGEHENTIGENGSRNRDKNDIYLGELEEKTAEQEGISIRTLTDGEIGDIHLTIVSHGGRRFLRVDTPGVQILDSASEVRLREGKFEEKPSEKEENPIDPILLTPLTGVRKNRIGKLFGFASAVKSGFVSNFRAKKKKLLRVCMIGFAATLVLLSAIFTAPLRQLEKTANSYDAKVFKVYLSTQAEYDKIALAAADPASGIDALRVQQQYAVQTSHSFDVGYFETAAGLLGTLDVDAELMPVSVLGEVRTLAGVAPEEAGMGLVLSRRVADAMIEASTVNYIKDYRDLIGMKSDITLTYYGISGQDGLNVVSVVDTDENAIFLTDLTLARVFAANGKGELLPASLFGKTVEKGHMLNLRVYYVYDEYDKEEYKKELYEKGWVEYVPEETAGDTVSIYGKNYISDGILWLSAEEIEEQVGTYGWGEYVLSDEDYIDAIFGFYNPYEGSEYTEWYQAVIHSKDIEATYASLRAATADFTLKSDRDTAFDGPNETKEGLTTDVLAAFIAKMTVLAVLAGLLCLCVFFIMRSSLISRVREVGIYRAVGVKKSNLVFRFAVESAVLTTLTVLVGYLAVSGGIGYLLANAPTARSFFYYPVWFAGALLVFLYGICILFGTLPVVSLLRRTPSGILSKYDI